MYTYNKEGEEVDQNSIAQEYINLMAVAFQILASASKDQLYLLAATCRSIENYEYVRSKFDQATGNKGTTLLEVIHELLGAMMDKSEAEKYSLANAICLCMDQRICYADIAKWENGQISLHSLVPIRSDKQPLVITTLNSNYKETGVCIAPKFPVSCASISKDLDGTHRRLSTRNALYGINRKLNNVIYYPWEKMSPVVHHIILPERSYAEEGTCIPEKTRIVFTPLTDRENLLRVCTHSICEINSFRCCGIAIDGLKDPDYIEQRFTDAWLASCRKAPDIFFAPEMLATDRMVSIEHGGSIFLKNLLLKAAIEGLNAPRLTVMPTYWRDGTNCLLVFDETGKHLGSQYKRMPYVNEKEGYAEALSPVPNSDILMVHLKNQQRVAFVICAEFLAQPEFVRDFLCGKLGATLILVPSFSQGEQDFVNMLPLVKPYGTSVIWGNCCGAVPSKDRKHGARIIGGCNLAGFDGQARFGSYNSCHFQCYDRTSCFFMVDIPTDILWEKPDSPSFPDIFHFC